MDQSPLEPEDDAQAGRIRAPYNIAIGHNTFTLEMLQRAGLGPVPLTTGGNLAKAIAGVAGPQSPVEGSSSTILLQQHPAWMGKIGVALLQKAASSLSKLLHYQQKNVKRRVAAKTFIDMLAPGAMPASPTMMAVSYSWTVPRWRLSQILLGNRNTIHGAGLLALGSFRNHRSWAACSRIFEDSFSSALTWPPVVSSCNQRMSVA